MVPTFKNSLRRPAASGNLESLLAQLLLRCTLLIFYNGSEARRLGQTSHVGTARADVHILLWRPEKLPRVCADGELVAQPKGAQSAMRFQKHDIGDTGPQAPSPNSLDVRLERREA